MGLIDENEKLMREIEQNVFVTKQRRDQQDKQRRDNIEKVKYTLYPSIDTSGFDRYDVERNDTIIQKNKDVKDVSKYNEIYRKLYGDDPNIEEKVKYIRPVSNVNMGEKCTIEVAKDEDLYNENTIFDSKKIKNINQIQRTSHEHVLKRAL